MSSPYEKSCARFYRFHFTLAWRGGDFPTASVTRSWMLSIAPAARRAHGSNDAGKWTRKCAVSIVRQGADGDCAVRCEAASARRTERKRTGRRAMRA
jgi:hypothetical protein